MKTMRAIKRINHNAAICIDAAGRQLIALGRGIGFGDMPKDIPMTDITRTFYNIDDRYLAFIGEVDSQVLDFAAQLAELAVNNLSYELSSNLPITLADHIQFALKRAREHMQISLPLAADVQLAHPVEYKIGEIAVAGMQKTFKVRVPRSEAVGVALSIVNAAISASAAADKRTATEDGLLEQATQIVERHMGVSVDRDSFAYARFSTHVRYLFKRVAENTPLDTLNAELYAVVVEQNPQAAACAREIGSAIEQAYDKPFAEEELLYLIMHINRIVSQE